MHNGPGYDFVAALAATRPWQVAPEGSSNEISLWFCSKLNVGKNLCLNHQGAMNYSHCCA